MESNSAVLMARSPASAPGPQSPWRRGSMASWSAGRAGRAGLETALVHQEVPRVLQEVSRVHQEVPRVHQEVLRVHQEVPRVLGPQELCFKVKRAL